ncbi:hypothetical protein L1994_00055 [Methanomicrobium antiquum]|jgi:hypothetical protein|uniref:Uncharacterized protein n=1 Tax=Methanomicrobium antiquum TaxID=487686 RepID=A0AAF0FRR1_9EURY|nr:hypothetical protein [Methanomicrobium antiquum]MDD4127537.1 hypothetical protein [Methanomicrobium sp.]WFN36826.1 hypothetical protein L1994_00055 [Methanomicrobium antiquum]
MTPYKFTESKVEVAALEWFADLGSDIISGYKIPVRPNASEQVADSCRNP